MDKVVLYICCSHLYIPTVLSASENNKDRRYVYTDKNDLVDFFSKYTTFTEVFYDGYELFNYKNKLFNDITRKRKIRKWADGINFTDVYFFHEGYCDPANWLMLYLTKRYFVKFHYVPIAKSNYLDRITVDRSLKSVLKSLYCKIMWGYSPIFSTRGDGCGILPQEFYMKLKIVEDETIVINKNKLSFLLNEDDYPSSSILLLSNPHINNEYQAGLYSKFLEKAIRPLMGKEIVLFKNHPGKDNRYGLENELREIPSVISGNLLTKRFKCFVGVDSALLWEAAKDGTKAICLAPIVDLPQEKKDSIMEFYDTLKRSTEESNGVVFYPKTIQEFWSLL